MQASQTKPVSLFDCGRSRKLKLKMSDLVSSTENQPTEDKANMTVNTSVKQGGGIGHLSASERLPKRAYRQPQA